MATVFLAPGPFGAGGQFFDNNGVPLSGGLINTYAAGTTTPTATYTTKAGTVQNANPIVLNSAGRITTEVWIPQGQAIKFAIVDSVSNLIQNYDDVYAVNDPTTVNGIGYTGATISGALVMNQAPINEAQGPNVPVAAAINLTASNGNYLALTGSGTVTSLQIPTGAYREIAISTNSCAFQASGTLIMLGGSITPAQGDILGFRGEQNGVARNVLYSVAGLGPVLAATQAQMTSATVTNAFVSPGREQFHPSAAKAWARYDSSGGLSAGYNVASVTRNGAGNNTITWTNGFNTSVYVVVATVVNAQSGTAATSFLAQVISTATGSCNVCSVRLSDFAQIDVGYVDVVAYGTLA